MKTKKVAYYKDLREHVKVLESKGKLVRITREINKDTELMPLVRWQYRGLPEEERKAFFFENVVDAKGKKYRMPVVVGMYAGSIEIYAIGMMCPAEAIMEKWAQAQLHPIKARMVADGPVHEEVHLGRKFLEHDGLGEIPVPISTPGFDNAPYFSAANWVTRDPETGLTNLGNYRAMVKSKNRTGVNVQPRQDLRTHWEKCRQMGKPLPAAIVIGASPVIGYVATAKLPLGDDYGVAGGIAGEPIELVKCKTVDIEVPATAEIVIEGEIPTDSLEREAPFGEYTGYMGIEMIQPYFNVTGITHRRDAIFNAFISQFTPSESSVLRHVGDESTLYKFLRYDCGLPVLDVGLHESSGSLPYCVIKMKKTHPAQPWQAMNGAAAHSIWRKIIIAVDDDIDPRDADAVNWALAYRVQAEQDVRIIPGRRAPLDPSVLPPGPDSEWQYPGPHGGSALMIDATRKWSYPPVSLPRREFMERARQIWEEEGLPKLHIKAPWHGYSLGYWTKENEEEAELAVKGEYYMTGEKLAKQRVQL